MAEERSYTFSGGAKIIVEMVQSGFVTIGSKYGGDQARAFSTPEGLIEWLSRELGAGPIVWSLTLDIWAEGLGIKPEDLLPVPDPAVDHVGYTVALGSNAAFLLKRFTEAELKRRAPQPPPEPKPKKEKKGKEKGLKQSDRDMEAKPSMEGLVEG